MNTKPQISITGLRSGRTAWTLSTTMTVHEDAKTYQLQVRHEYPEDVIAFIAYDAGSEETLLAHAEYLERRDAIIEHEGHGPCAVAGCANPDGAEYNVAGRALVNADGCPVLGICGVHAHDAELHGVSVAVLQSTDAIGRAQAILAQQGVRAMWAAEERLRTELQTYWDAFALLFNPSVNL